MGSPNPTDPYLDPATGVLRNLVGATSWDQLQEAEADLVLAQKLELDERDDLPASNLDDLRQIHRHLFQDVYGWAGEIRAVDIQKSDAAGESFVHVALLDRAAGTVFAHLHDDGLLDGMDHFEFIDVGACVLALPVAAERLLLLSLGSCR